MTHYDYLIIGGGLAADAGVRGIREVDPTGSIAVVSDEPHPPYDRPPLSKKLWTGKPEKSIWRNTFQLSVELLLSRNVVSIDPVQHTALDNSGEQHGYEKLLLATGGIPRHLPHNDEGVIYFRTLDDYHRLRQMSSSSEKFVVIGGGFIGSEVAAALSMNGNHVTMIFPGKGIGDKVYPPGLVEFISNHYRSKGVELLVGEKTTDIVVSGRQYAVTTSSGHQVIADGVVAGIGIQPAVALAQSAGLQVDNGIVVDEYLRTSNPEIYAAGDVANFYSPALDKHRRVEHEDNAKIMGVVAGRNMAGLVQPYHHLPFFYSDLFDLGYEAVGELDTNLEVVEDWTEKFRKGVIYYHTSGQVRGVLLWNVWGKVDEARTLITSHQTFNAEELIGRIRD